MTFIIFLIVYYKLLILINGSHFLGGTITWSPLNQSATGSPVAIVITQTYSWTYSLITCTSTDIATNQLIPLGGYTALATNQLNCTNNCGNGSAGYVAPLIRPYCTDISAPVGTTVGQRSDTVYLQTGDDFSVAFQNIGWRVLTPTNSSSPWSISSHIKISPRPDNGLYNSAPVATMMSPVYIPQSQQTVIHVPVADGDGDTIRCRWSTASNGTDECGGVCPPSSLPSNTTIYPNCTIIITGTNAGDWFAVALMVEDFITPTSTTPLSGVPVQFLVHVVSPSPCATLPQIVGIPLEQSCIPVIVGQTYNSALNAINYCGSNVTIVDIATLSFSGMVKGNLTKANITTYYTSLSWTPTSSQLGYQVMCAMAIDSDSSQSSQYCFKFYVSQSSVCACPGDVCSTTQQPQQQPHNTIDWSIIGVIIGLVLLGILFSSCCLWCYIIRPFGGYINISQRKFKIQLYHIEQCQDPNCYIWRDYSSYSDDMSISRNCATIDVIILPSANGSKEEIDYSQDSLLKSMNDDQPKLTSGVNEKGSIIHADVEPRDVTSSNNMSTVRSKVRRRVKVYPIFRALESANGQQLRYKRVKTILRSPVSQVSTSCSESPDNEYVIANSSSVSRSSSSSSMISEDSVNGKLMQMKTKQAQTSLIKEIKVPLYYATRKPSTVIVTTAARIKRVPIKKIETDSHNDRIHFKTTRIVELTKTQNMRQFH